MTTILRKIEHTARVVLCMIVKNDDGSDESHCITRCLDSCRGLISSAVIALTNSGTKSNMLRPIIEGWAERNGTPVVMDDWQWGNDFAAARNFSLALAQRFYADAEWILLIDADEELNVGKHLDHIKRMLATAPQHVNAFIIPLVIGGQVISRVNIIRNRLGWLYRFRHHETLELHGQPFEYVLMGDATDPRLGPYVTTKQDGARSKDPEKLAKDIVVLLGAIKEEPDEPRYLFYLAMAYMMAGRIEDGYEAFKEYVIAETSINALGTIYYALLSMGRYEAKAGDAVCVEHWHQAFKLCPTRVEALGEIATFYAQRNQWAECYLHAAAAAQVHHPTQLDFVEPSWSQWRALDILTAALINLGMYAPAINYLNVLLARTTIPMGERVRIQDNLNGVMKGMGHGTSQP